MPAYRESAHPIIQIAINASATSTWSYHVDAYTFNSSVSHVSVIFGKGQLSDHMGSTIAC
jgi:hypothetical protein